MGKTAQDQFLQDIFQVLADHSQCREEATRLDSPINVPRCRRLTGNVGKNPADHGHVGGQPPPPHSRKHHTHHPRTCTFIFIFIFIFIIKISLSGDVPQAVRSSNVGRPKKPNRPKKPATIDGGVPQVRVWGLVARARVARASDHQRAR